MLILIGESGQPSGLSTRPQIIGDVWSWVRIPNIPYVQYGRGWIEKIQRASILLLFVT